MKKYLTYLAVILITATTFAACSKSRLVGHTYERTLTIEGEENVVAGYHFSTKTTGETYVNRNGVRREEVDFTYSINGNNGRFSDNSAADIGVRPEFTVRGQELIITRTDGQSEPPYTRK